MSEFKELVDKLSTQITETGQFKKLVSALEAVKSNEEALKLFEEFQSAQAQIQALQMTGQKPDDDQIKEWQKISEITQSNELIKNLSEAEMGINGLLEEVNDKLTEPLNTLYN